MLVQKIRCVFKAMNLASVVSWSMFFVFFPYQYYLCLILSLRLWTRRISFATMRHEILVQETSQRKEPLDLTCWLHHHPVLNEWMSRINSKPCYLLKWELILDMESLCKLVILTYTSYLGIYYLTKLIAFVIIIIINYCICAHTSICSHVCHNKFVGSENNFKCQFSSIFTWVSETELSSPGLWNKLFYRQSHLIIKATS